MTTNPNRGDQKGTKLSIIQTLRINGSVSRIELTRLTGLSRATISLAIAELIDSGLVQETDARHSTGGRPATLLTLTRGANVIIGADYSEKKLTLGAFDLLGNLLDHTAIHVNDNSPKDIFQALGEHFEAFKQPFGNKTVHLLGIGLPGLIDITRGTIMTITAPDYQAWSDINFAEEIEKVIGCPTIVLNRHRARGLAECRYGAGKEFNEVVYIGIGSGIAAGIFSNRKLMFGAIGGAGEIGHLTMVPNGPLCSCGNSGCLEELATARAMEREIRMLLRSGRFSTINNDNQRNLLNTHADAICKGADEGDPLCREVVENAARYLGIAMANLVNTVNPEIIILGGEIPNKCAHYVETAKQVMHQKAMGPLAAGVTIATASHTGISGALGAANFALDQNLGYSLLFHAD